MEQSNRGITVLDRELIVERDYWLERLSGPQARDIEPTGPRPDFPRGASGVPGGTNMLPLEVTGDLLAKLTRLTGGGPFLLATTLMTVLAVCCHKTMGGRSVVIGSPARAAEDGSHPPNLLAVVVGMDDGDRPFRDLLLEVRQTLLEAYARQRYPFERLLQDLGKGAAGGRSAPFDVVLALRGLHTEVPDAGHGLTLTFEETPDALLGTAVFRTDLFHRYTIQRFAAHFLNLLAAAVKDTAARIGDLSPLSPAERFQLLTEWNDTAGDFPRDRCIHQLVEASARNRPHAVAVAFEGRKMTYGELNWRANQLARLLQQRGVGPGSRVGVWMGGCLEIPMGLLAILKAGGTYVPIDTSWPLQRVHQILAKVGARCLLIRAEELRPLHEVLGELPDLRDILCVDVEEEAVASVEAGPRILTAGAARELPGDDLSGVAVTPGDLAYIIHTSGSTGTPKGVVIRHQAAVNLIDWVNCEFQVGPADRLLFVTSLSFDLSVYDVFGILAAGGTIQVATGREFHDPMKLRDLLSREPITFWDSAPAMMQQLVPSFPQEGPLPGGSLRLIFLAGDWIPVTLPQTLSRVFPGAEVINLGGTTETTIFSNLYRVRKVDPGWASIPYGRPLRNTQYYVLDSRLDPCPVGVAGEFYIGGDGVAVAYFGEPALTAWKMVPDPFRSEPGARLYRTGDRGRFWADGTMEFLGRIDNQVKIRGNRIELSEVDAVLSQHPEVREAVSMAREDRPGEKLLAAYLVPREGHRPTASELQRFVRERLPEPMVPSDFVLLDELPLTPNGKVDRAALLTLRGTRAGTDGAFVAPRTPLEETLARIWSEVLDVERVGIEDNFFELGGHSLRGTQVVSRVKELFQIDLPLRHLFRNPTVAELARIIEESRGAPAAPARPAPELVPLARKPRKTTRTVPERP